MQNKNVKTDVIAPVVSVSAQNTCLAQPAYETNNENTFSLIGLVDQPGITFYGDNAHISMCGGQVLVKAARVNDEDDPVGPWAVTSVSNPETREEIGYGYGEFGTEPFTVLVNYTLEAARHSKLVKRPYAEDEVIYAPDWLDIGGHAMLGAYEYKVSARHIHHSDNTPQRARFAVSYVIGDPDGEYVCKTIHAYTFVRTTHQQAAPAPHNYPGKLVYTCEDWPASMRNSQFLSASVTKSFAIPVWPDKKDPLTELALICLLTWDKTAEDLCYEQSGCRM